MRPRLFVHALRSARPRQLRGRALRPLRRRRFGGGEAPPLRALDGPTALWRSAAFEPVALAGTGSERLRRFHSHYGEDVLAAARAGDVATATGAAERWIETNPPRAGDAWHPYPTSTRVGNWIAALALEPSLQSTAVRQSLWRQLLRVARNVEEDILGNHLVRNARALVLGGAAFGSGSLLERGLDLLARELPEQVLPDGGHYERSPVYHLVVLRDLLEIGALVDHPEVAAAIERMTPFAAALARPDGQPALFNDGTLDLAPALELPAPPTGLALFPETGYAVVRSARVWLAFDCGPPSPPFLPAHAHADALSFQLWVDGAPVVVDPGIPSYEAGSERDWFRGTRAHSTVAVDGDQFELWGAFRSGPLPTVELLEASDDALEAAVTGRASVRHVRRIEIESGTIGVRDSLQGTGTYAVETSLPLAPDRAAPDVSAAGHTPERERRPVAERFFQRQQAPALVVRQRLSLPAELGWTIPTG